jgi:tetratricopeptide (TPR) repeat protein
MSSIFSALRDWRERREILRDARRRQADRDEQLRFTVRDELELAILCLERGDKPGATSIWERMMEDHPATTKMAPLALKVLLGLRRFEEAEAVMKAGQKKRPNDPFFANGLAEISYAKHDFDALVEHAAFLRKRFPGALEGYTFGARAFREKGLIAEAEALALQAINKFPDQLVGAWEYANIAVKKEDWGEALRRWRMMQEKFRFPAAPIGAAEALRHMGRYDEAEEVIKLARLEFSVAESLHYEFARIAEARGDIAEAVRRWKGTLYRFPLNISVYLTVVEAFERLGEPAEAEATLRAAIERFPNEPRPLLDLAKLFDFKRKDFPAAAEAWAALRAAFPDNEESYRLGAAALARAGRTAEAEALLKEHQRHFAAS